MSSNRIPTARAAGATRVEKLCGRAGRIPVFAFDLHISPRHLVRSRRRCVSMPTHLAAAEAFIAYDAPSVHYSDALLDYLATRFEFSDQITAPNIEQLKQRNPDFYALFRNSLSDNFVPPAASSLTQEHEWMFAHAGEYGVDPE